MLGGERKKGGQKVKKERKNIAEAEDNSLMYVIKKKKIGMKSVTSHQGKRKPRTL